MLFLDVVEIVLSTFSRKFFRDTLFHEYLDIAHDPVPNIRLRFVSVLSLARRTLRMPMDTSLLQKLTDATEPLLTRDLDHDVVQATGDVFAELGLFGFGPNESDFHLQIRPDKNSSKAMQSSQESVTDKYLTSYIPEADEKLDKQKEDEEHALLVKEWESDEYRRRDHDLAKRLGEKSRTQSFKGKIEIKKSATIRRKPSVTASPNQNDGRDHGPATGSSKSSAVLPFAGPSRSASLKGASKDSNASLPMSPLTKPRTMSMKSASYSHKADNTLVKSGGNSPKFLHSPRISIGEADSAPVTPVTRVTPRNVSAPPTRHSIGSDKADLINLSISPPSNSDKSSKNTGKLSRPGTLKQPSEESPK